MPRATAQLTKASSTEEVKKAIDATIAELVKSGYAPDQASALAHEEARKKTGEQLRKR